MKARRFRFTITPNLASSGGPSLEEHSPVKTLMRHGASCRSSCDASADLNIGGRTFLRSHAPSDEGYQSHRLSIRNITHQGIVIPVSVTVTVTVTVSKTGFRRFEFER